MLKAALPLLLLLSTFAHAQQVVDLEENQPYTSNGLDYSYYISNEKSKEVKGDDYDRFELNIVVTNNSGCIKLIPFRAGWSSNNNTTEDNVLIAEFNCTNATGKRLTAKKGTVNAKPWYTTVRIQDDSVKEKYRKVNAQAGYALRNGEAASAKIIVIVPKGERPKVNCRIVFLAEY